MVDAAFFHDSGVPIVAQAATIARMPGRPPKPIVNPPNRIREVREAKGLTQDQVAGKVGVTGATIAKYETGDAAVSVHQLGRIARALGVKAYTLISDYEPPRDGEESAVIAILRRLGPNDRQRAILLLAALEQSGQHMRAG